MRKSNVYQRSIALLCVVLALTSVLVWPQTVSAAADARVDTIAYMDAGYCTEMDSWTGNAITSSITTLDGQPAIKLTGTGTGWFPDAWRTGAPENWTGAGVLETRVQNLGASVAGFMVLLTSGGVHFTLKAGTRVELQDNGKPPVAAFASINRTIDLPANFNGVVRISLTNTDHDMGVFGVTADIYNTSDTARVSFGVENVAGTDGVVVGASYLRDSWSLPDYIQLYDYEDLTQGNLNDMMIWSGGLSIAKTYYGNDCYIKMANGTAWLPSSPYNKQDWTGAVAYEISVVNENQSAVSFRYYSTNGSTHFTLADGSPVQLVTEAGALTTVTTTGGGLITLPASFAGRVRIPVSGVSYDHVAWTPVAAWNASTITGVSFQTGVPNTTLAFGMPKLWYTTHYNAVSIDYLNTMTTESIAWLKDPSWGMPNGLEKVIYNDNHYVKMTGAGYAWLDNLPAHMQNWTGAKMLEISVVNETANDLYLTTGLTTSNFQVAYGSYVQIVPTGGAIQETATTGSGQVCLPPNFTGVVRYALNPADYGAGFSLDAVNRVYFSLPADAIASVGEWKLLYKIPTKEDALSSGTRKLVESYDSYKSQSNFVVATKGLDDPNGTSLYFHQTVKKDEISWLSAFPNSADWDWSSYDFAQLYVKNDSTKPVHVGFTFSAVNGASLYEDSAIYNLKSDSLVWLIPKNGKAPFERVVGTNGYVVFPPHFEGYLRVPLKTTSFERISWKAGPDAIDFSQIFIVSPNFTAKDSYIDFGMDSLSVGTGNISHQGFTPPVIAPEVKYSFDEEFPNIYPGGGAAADPLVSDGGSSLRFSSAAPLVDGSGGIAWSNDHGTDWDYFGAKYLDLYVKNHKNEALDLGYIITETKPGSGKSSQEHWLMAKGGTAYLFPSDGSPAIPITCTSGMRYNIPANFEGVLRIKPNQTNFYTEMWSWADGQMDLDRISNINLYLDNATYASADVSVDNFTAYYDESTFGVSPYYVEEEDPLPPAESSVYTLDEETGLLRDVPVGTTEALLLSGLTLNDATAVVTGLVSGRVATGSILTVTPGVGDPIVYTVSVPGDVSGDGLVNASDLTSIKQILLSIGTTIDAQNIAGDLNAADGTDITDLVALKKYIVLEASVASMTGTVINKSFTDNNAVVHNPLMGWQYITDVHEVITQGVPEEYDIIVLRASWDELEPQEGDFRFDRLNEALRIIKEAGKTVVFRMYLMPDNVWGHDGTPYWIWEAPHNIPGVLTTDNLQSVDGPDIITTIKHPEYWDTGYQALVRDFLTEVAANLGDGGVDVLDLRCYNMYGEWDADWNMFPWENYASGLKSTTLNQLVNIYNDVFGAMNHTLVAINVTANNNSNYAAYKAEVALDTAMGYGFGIRFDGIGMINVPSDQVGRKLIDQYYATNPVFSETYYGYPAKRADAEASMAAFLDIHANAISMGQFIDTKDTFLTEYGDLYTQGMLNMGYRLIPTNVSYNNVVAAGGTFTLNTSWINKGVGTLYQKYPLAITLVDGNGNVVYRGLDSSFHVKGLVKGSSANKVSTFTLPETLFSLKKGTLKLYISLADEQTGQDAIALPVTGSSMGRSYYVGDLTVK